MNITLPAEIDERLSAETRRQGVSPEVLVVETLRKWFVLNDGNASAGSGVAQHTADGGDPLASHIGAFNTGITDWTARHDDYLGRAHDDSSRKSDG